MSYKDKVRFAWGAGSGYKATKMYSQYPITDKATFDAAAFDVSRTTTPTANNATRVDENGLIVKCNDNVPRWDYSDGGSCPKLLTEVSRTNYLTDSNNFTGYSQFGGSVSITLNYGVSPSGENDSQLLVFSGASVSLYKLVTTTTTCATSLYVKGTKGETINVTLGRASVGDLNLITLTGDWQRVEEVNNGGETSSASIHTYGGATARTIEAYGFQVEYGDSVTSYIPTNGAEETRGADQITGAGDSDTFNSTSGVLFADVKNLNLSEGSAVGIANGDSPDEIINIFLRSDGEVMGSVYNSSAQAYMRQTYDMSLQNKYSLRYASNDFSLWINGIKFQTDSSGSVPSINKLGLVSYGTSNPMQGKTNSILHYDYLTDEEMVVLTGYSSYDDMTNQFGFNTL